MPKKALTVVTSVFISLILLLCSGCDFSTTVISDTESPDLVLTRFLDALKEKDYNKADSYLANYSTIKPTNNTDYAFMDTLADVSLNSLNYQLIGTPSYDGVNAVTKVCIHSLDKQEMISWVADNLNSIANNYMKENGLNTLNLEDHEVLSKVLEKAILLYAAEGKTVENTIEVRFIFTDNQWKITGNNDLVTSIFGGSVNEEK